MNSVLINSFDNIIDYKVNGDNTCYKNCIDDVVKTCRCFKITSVDINKIYLNKLVDLILLSKNNKYQIRDRKINSILYNYDINSINTYCINRILTINKVYDKKSWTYNKNNDGYYGEEINNILLINEIDDAISSQINRLYQIFTIEEKIKYILYLEYGYVLPVIEGKMMIEDEVYKKSIFLGQEFYKSEISKIGCPYYSDYCYPINMPRCIVIETDGKIKMLDGYHRYLETNQEKIKIIKIINDSK